MRPKMQAKKLPAAKKAPPRRGATLVDVLGTAAPYVVDGETKTVKIAQKAGGQQKP